MGNFHIKSLILGIGIGVILTSVISMVYMAGMDSRQKISEEEVIRLAGELGMVKSASIIKSEPLQPEEHAKKDIARTAKDDGIKLAK